MGFLRHVLAEAVWYFVGLDLGQSRDHSALAVVERADLVLDEIDHVTYARLMERRYCGFWSGLRWGRRIQTWWSGCARWYGPSPWWADAPWLWTRPELGRRWWTCLQRHSWAA